MARKRSQVLTDGERRIMDILWRRGEAPIRAVADELAGAGGAANATVNTMLKILETKGFVERRKEGRAFVYAPTVTRAQARSSALGNMLAQFFDGSPEALAQHLLKDTDLDLDKLEAIERSLDDSQEDTP